MKHARKTDENQSDAFKAISDPTRRKILDRLLRYDGLQAGKIAEGFDMSRIAVHKHLKVLEGSGLVEVKKMGRERIYSINSRPLKDVDDWLVRYRLHFAARLHELKEEFENKKGERK